MKNFLPHSPQPSFAYIFPAKPYAARVSAELQPHPEDANADMIHGSLQGEGWVSGRGRPRMRCPPPDRGDGGLSPVPGGAGSGCSVGY